MDIIKSIEKHIKILKQPLLENEDDIMAVLKKRLTKKELKTFLLKEDGVDNATICKELNMEEDRVHKIYDTVIKKLNQEKLKQELSE